MMMNLDCDWNLTQLITHMTLYYSVEESPHINDMDLKCTKIISCMMQDTFWYLELFYILTKYNQIQPQNKRGLLIQKINHILYNKSWT